MFSSYLAVAPKRVALRGTGFNACTHNGTKPRSVQKIAKNQLNVFFSWNHWLLKFFEEKQFSTSFPCMFATIFTIGFNCFRFCWFPFRENATSLEILVTHNCLFSTDFPMEYIATILGYLQSIFTSSDYLEYNFLGQKYWRIFVTYCLCIWKMYFVRLL